MSWFSKPRGGTEEIEPPFVRVEDLHKTFILKRWLSWIDNDDEDEEEDDEDEFLTKEDREEQQRRARVLHEAAQDKTRREQKVLTGISFEARPGEVIGVVGAPGSGKSTLIDILARKTAPTEGAVFGRGLVVAFADIQRPIAARTSMRSNFRFMAAMKGLKKHEVDPLIDRAASLTGTSDYLEVRASRVPAVVFSETALIFGLLLQPDILLFDNVRELNSRRPPSQFPELLANYIAKGHSITFIVANRATSIKEHATRAIWLDKGRIEMDGNVQEVVGTALQSLDAGGRYTGAKQQDDKQELEPINELLNILVARRRAETLEPVPETTPSYGDVEASEMIRIDEAVAVLKPLLIDGAKIISITKDKPRPRDFGVPRLDDTHRLEGLGIKGFGRPVSRSFGPVGEIIGTYVNTPEETGVFETAPGVDTEVQVFLRTREPNLKLQARGMLMAQIFEEGKGCFSGERPMAKIVSNPPMRVEKPGIYSMRIGWPGFLFGQMIRLSVCRLSLTIEAMPADFRSILDVAIDTRPARTKTTFDVSWAVRGDRNRDAPLAQTDNILKSQAIVLRPDLPWSLEGVAETLAPPARARAGSSRGPSS